MSHALLAANVLIALLDPDHLDHDRAHAWAERHMNDGWATCAITQNGLVRILSQPAYPNGLTVAGALALLGEATADPRHVFWNCDLQLTKALVDAPVLGPRQVTDSYLLALAIAHDGMFVTLDTRVSPGSVAGAQAHHVVVVR